MEVLKSKLDESVNIAIPRKDGGFLETRFVKRGNKSIIYLSSHTGCKMACRFCHLTATGQTMMTEATLDDYIIQLQGIAPYCQERDILHFNFMARGEPLKNSTITNNFSSLYEELYIFADPLKIPFKTKISTILPEFTLPLEYIFDTYPVDIYYSLYSFREEFRKRWLPNAVTAYSALEKLQNYQNFSKRNIVFHWALIKDENDSDLDLQQIKNNLSLSKIKGRINLVRYNPANDKSTESDRYDIFQKELSKVMPCKIIDRVGYDVNASCGMFVS